MENSGNSSKTRRPAVAGTFYPEDKGQLASMVDGFLKAAQEAGSDNVRAVIVPHAGYVFSGQTAAKAFAEISPEHRYGRIFLLGPSHCAAIDGASVDSTHGFYATPLGEVAVDGGIARQLAASDSLFVDASKACSDEHCLEVQLPFLQRRLAYMPPIVPIVIGTQDGLKLRRIAEALEPYFNEDNLFVVSSDFSHYPSYNDAVKADTLTGRAIESGSLKAFAEALNDNYEARYPGLCTSACGQCAIAVLMMLAEWEGGIAIRHLDYCNSGDSPYGGRDRVVGYHSFAFCSSKQAKSEDDAFSLSVDEKKTLLKIARRSIESKLGMPGAPMPSGNDITPSLKSECGAFVTLNEGGRLRGCIGNLVGHGPLHKLVGRMACLAAFEDPRFMPVVAGEMQNIDIEISVLSPLRRIKSLDEFELGRHGIFIVKDGHSGTFLPQVADEVNWTKEEFVSHCSRDKAGLGWDGWRDAELYVYEAAVFDEKSLLG